MRLLQLTFLLTISFLIGCTANNKNDWAMDELQGRVQSYSESKYYAVERFGNIEKEKSLGGFEPSFLKKYDKNGNMIEFSSYSSDGSISDKSSYKYDKKGNPIEFSSYSSDGSLDSKTTYEYEFDRQGNWVKKIGFVDGKPYTIYEREYVYY